jgi:hypothetical protein
MRGNRGKNNTGVVCDEGQFHHEISKRKRKKKIT